jgi:hypothetical protein
MAEPFYITTAISYPNGRRTSATPMKRSPPTSSPASSARRAATCASDRHRRAWPEDGPDRPRRRPRHARVRGRNVGHFREMCDGLDISYDRFVRTSEPRHHRGQQAIWKAMEARATCTSTATKAGIRSATRPFTTKASCRRGGGEKLSPQGTPVEWTAEESWFFRCPPISSRCSTITRQSRLHPPESRRNEVLRFVEGGLKDPQRLAHQLRLGRAGAGLARPRHVRLGRRADHLHDRRRLSRRRRVRPLLAGRPPPDRQGHRPLPRGLLAGLPDAPACRCPSRSSATASCSPRREDVEEPRQRRRPDGAGRALRRRSACAIS